jgi:putative transcriptional regulator
MSKTYKSDMMRVLHEGMADLYESGLVDKATMRRFDARCLTPTEPMTGEEIAALRERERVSQSVFARTLGVSLNTVSQWERGERKATGAALKLLSLAKAHGLDYVR